MGQNVSQPQGGALGAHQQPQMEERPRRRGSPFAALILDATSSSADSTTTDDAGRLLHDHAGSNTTSTRSISRNRFSQLLPSFSNTNSDASLVHASPHRSALRRSRTTLTNLFRRHPFQQTQQSRASAILQNRSSYMRAAELDTTDEIEAEVPRLPSIDHSSSFLERDIFPMGNTSSNDAASNTSQPGRTASSLFDMRRNGAQLRRLGSALRRRRSPGPSMRRGAHGEDQAVLLSQLLSAAAAATAATLMGDDHQALNEARSLSVGTGIGDLGGSGEDGSFEGFLRALQSGRIASALRQSGEAADGTEVSPNGSLNFFRMFRFGSVAPDAPSTESPAAEGRMIPIIIVGIRSISPSSGPDSSPSNDLPPFLDALTSLASSAQDTEELEGLGQDSIDSILRPAHNSTSFRHRRRASMGAFGSNRRRVTDYYDELRDQRMPERRRERPWSVASSLSNELRPPPATPASPSPELSRISSRNSTPAHSRPASFIANSIRELTGESRRNSALHRSVSSPLAIHTEETVSVHSARSSDNLLRHSSSDHRWDSTHRQPETATHTHYPRFASGHPRRNGMVGPDEPSHLRPATSSAGRNSDGDARNDSRSWIIYVLGGSYPENHPILTTPSLFSDNPTYEDMMLLSALLGPAKAPVASQEDVQNAGGTYTVIAPIDTMTDDHKVSELIAIATEDTNLDSNPARVALEAEHRCLVCLSDFQVEEVLRRLGKCGHLFHKDCIDHWLTQGRNSCPLCRGEGVEEKSKSDPLEQVPTQVAVDA